MCFTKLCSPDAPRGWLATATWWLTNHQLFIVRFIQGNELCDKWLQPPYQIKLSLNAGKGQFKHVSLALLEESLQNKGYSKFVSQYSGTNFFSWPVCLWFSPNKNPGFHQSFSFSVYKNLLVLSAAKLRFQSQEMNTSLKMWAKGKNNSSGTRTKVTKGVKNKC